MNNADRLAFCKREITYSMIGWKFEHANAEVHDTYIESTYSYTAEWNTGHGDRGSYLRRIFVNHKIAGLGPQCSH